MKTEVERIDDELAAIDALIRKNPEKEHQELNRMKRCTLERREKAVQHKGRIEAAEKRRVERERVVVEVERQLWEEGSLWYKITNTYWTCLVIVLGGAVLAINSLSDLLTAFTLSGTEYSPALYPNPSIIPAGLFSIGLGAVAMGLMMSNTIMWSREERRNECSEAEEP